MIALNAEEATSSQEGTLRLVRRHLRHPRDDDHTDERLALYRHAAREARPNADVTVELAYAPSGERRTVDESPRYEPKRLAKYDEALKGIREAQFEPDPDDAKCARCPYLFICPA